MVTLHIEGLSICVFDTKSHLLRICMLNAGFNETLDISHHLQTLVVNKGTYSSGLATLASVKGRLSSARFLDAYHEAWDLSSLVVKIDGGAGLPTKYQDNLEDMLPNGTKIVHPHPDPANPDWSPLHWVLPFERYLPGCTLPTDAQMLGPKTSAIAEVTGGVCYGRIPETLGGEENLVWAFGKVEQAATDAMDIQFTAVPPASAVPTVKLFDKSGVLIGEIKLNDGAEVWLINEATDRDILTEMKAFNVSSTSSPEHGRHLNAYLEVLNSAGTPLPTVAYPWLGPIVRGTFCITGRLDQ